MENLIELNELELLTIEGGLTSEEWGYRMGRALATTVNQCGTIFGLISSFV